MLRSARVGGLLAAVLLAGCGGSAHPQTTTTKPTQPRAATPGDVEAGSSAPLAAGVRLTRKAAAPSAIHVPKTAGATQPGVSPGAPTDAEIKAELKQMEQVQAAQRKLQTSRPSAPLLLTTIGNARTPGNAPQAVAAILAGANQIARFPYVYGGGHRSFVDTAYDCSGSVSYALATAGMLAAPLTSGELAHWGAPGPGRWVTIFANAGHTFMYVAGTRFDTSGRSGVLGSRWQTAPRSIAGFTVRHPPGL
jgi:cell wall-associated NlpC family hydrolase